MNGSNEFPEDLQDLIDEYISGSIDERRLKRDGILNPTPIRDR